MNANVYFAKATDQNGQPVYIQQNEKEATTPKVTDKRVSSFNFGSGKYSLIQYLSLRNIVVFSKFE